MHEPIDRAVSNSDLLRLLNANIPAAGFLDRWKIRLRPYVCPFDLLLSHVEPGLSYFDIGCGSGMFLRILAEYKKPVALGGVEVSARLIDNAASLLKSCKVPLALQVYDGLDLPAEFDRYDWAFLIDVLHHVPPTCQERFLGRVFERMRPGQRLLIKDIDAGSWLVYWNKLHDLVLSKEVGSELRVQQATESLRRIGFVVQTSLTKRVYAYPHYVLRCVKPD